jgi:hypothetical protein
MNRKGQRAERIAFKIPNRKFQITNILQISISNGQKVLVLDLGDWNLLEMWCLDFGASMRLDPMRHALCAMRFYNCGF